MGDKRQIKTQNIMTFDLERFHRRSIRLKNYDYSLPGFYFVTICTKDRQSLFGEIIGGEMILSELGKIVLEEWLKTPSIRRNVKLDFFIIMPNHIHAIVIITEQLASIINHAINIQPAGCVGDCVGVDCNQPLQNIHQYGPQSNNLFAIVRGFKGAVAKRFNEIHQSYGVKIWQRGFYDHIIRGEKDMYNIQGYILGNPSKWQADLENLQLYKHWTEREREYFVQRHYDELFGE